MRDRAAAFVFAFAVGVLAPVAAIAQAPNEDAVARSHFATGASAFDSGRYEVALSEFEAAYGLSHRPELLYNIGLCHDRLRHDHDALQSFESFLAARPDTTHRAEVEPRIAALHAAIARDDADRAERDRAEQERIAAARTTAVHHDDVWASPWLWLGVGLAVVAAVVIGVVLATQDPGVQAPIPGADGVVMALRF